MSLLTQGLGPGGAVAGHTEVCAFSHDEGISYSGHCQAYVADYALAFGTIVFDGVAFHTADISINPPEVDTLGSADRFIENPQVVPEPCPDTGIQIVEDPQAEVDFEYTPRRR